MMRNCGRESTHDVEISTETCNRANNKCHDSLADSRGGRKLYFPWDDYSPPQPKENKTKIIL